MFRKIKKIYFKIYHLLKLLGIFIIVVGTIPIVKADVTTCDDKLVSSSLSIKSDDGYWHMFTYNDSSTGYCIPYSSTGTYYFKFFPETTIEGFSSSSFQVRNVTSPNGVNGSTISSNISFNPSTNILSFLNNSSSSGCMRFYYIGRKMPFAVAENTPLLMSKNLSDIENCTLAPETPPEPEQEGNEVYNNFITMYAEKIKYLAEGFTNNKYLLAMIGIIMSWIVLELFLKILHLKGGYKK